MTIYKYVEEGRTYGGIGSDTHYTFELIQWLTIFVKTSEVCKCTYVMN